MFWGLPDAGIALGSWNGTGMPPGFPNEAEGELSHHGHVRWVLIFHPYQEHGSVQPRVGGMQSGCCDLPSAGVQWKIQVLALLALLK